MLEVSWVPALGASILLHCQLMYMLISFLLFFFETDESHFKDDIEISLPDNVVPGSVYAIISTVGKKCY